MLKTVIILILILEVLILTHEAGHFITARLVGIRVNEFAIGMGPAIFKKKKKETQFSLRIFPIGGYVAMEGEDAECLDEHSFSQKSPLQKMLVVSAGSIMNYLTGIVILTVMIFMLGAPSTTIDSVADGSSAATAGIMSGDKILSINNTATDTWQEVVEAIQAAGESSDTVTVEVERKSKESSIIMDIPLMQNDDGRNIIGINTLYKRNLLSSIKSGTVMSVKLIGSIYQSFAMIFKGEVSSADVVGPIGIANFMNTAMDEGLYNVLFLAALLAVNLAIINMLPLPALDGGRFFILLITVIIRKKINPELEGRIHYIGFLLLIGLIIAITIKDFNQFILN